MSLLLGVSLLHRVTVTNQSASNITDLNVSVGSKQVVNQPLARGASVTKWFFAVEDAAYVIDATFAGGERIAESVGYIDSFFSHDTLGVSPVTINWNGSTIHNFE